MTNTAARLSPELLQKMTRMELESAALFFRNWADDTDFDADSRERNARFLSQVKAEMERRAAKEVAS